MDIVVGFVYIKKNATTCRGAKNPEEFMGQTCAVMEFAKDGGVMCFNPQKTALAMFEIEDIIKKFECSIVCDVICPPNQDLMQNMAYVTKCMMRKGGYNKLLAMMVVEASLMKGKFTDSFLWQLQ